MTAVVALVALIATTAGLPLGHFMYPPRLRKDRR